MAFRRTIATIAALNLLAVTNLPPPSRANPAVAASAACAVPGVGWVSCAVLGTVMVAGSVYLLVQLNSGEQMQLPRQNVRAARRGIPNVNDRPARAEIRGEESHGVTDPNQCYRMAERFRQAGRRVRLKRIDELNTNGVLKYVCVFQGEGAEDDWYGDRWNR